MDSERRPAILTEVLGDVVRCTLGADKDEDFGVFVGDLVEVLQELVTLIEFRADLDHLCDVHVSSELHRTDIDLDVVSEEVLERRSVSKTKTGQEKGDDAQKPTFARPWAR